MEKWDRESKPPYDQVWYYFNKSNIMHEYIRKGLINNPQKAINENLIKASELGVEILENCTAIYRRIMTFRALAELYYNLNVHDKAFKLIESGLKEKPDDIFLNTFYGIYAYNSGNLNIAINIFNQIKEPLKNNEILINNDVPNRIADLANEYILKLEI